MYSFFRELLASEEPILQKFAVVDPTAVGNNIRAITLAYTPPNDDSSVSIVALFWADSSKKLYEKHFQDDAQAQSLFTTMRRDLSEAEDLTKKEKTSAAMSLVSSLLKRYAIYTDDLAVAEVPPVTNTMANKKASKIKLEEGQFGWDYIIKNLATGETILIQTDWDYPGVASAFGWPGHEHSETDGTIDCPVCGKTPSEMIEEASEWLDSNIGAQVEDPGYFGNKEAARIFKVRKKAKVVMQNLFFETPEELMEYQDKMKGKQSPADKQLGEFKDDLPKTEIEEEMAPSSLSYEDYEKQKAEEAKSLTKRIETEVKEQVESALEQKVASTFDKTDDALVKAMRGKGRTWEEIKKYFTKELKYEEDSVSAYIDAYRQAESAPSISEPSKIEPPKETPEAPKPPENLVSPETHDKLVKEIVEPEVKEIENQYVSAEEISMQDTEIQKVAEEPLETVPKQHMQKGNDELIPQFTDVADEMKDIEAPISEDFVESVPVEEPINVGDSVYVMGNYETSEPGYEGKLAGKYTSDGEDYAVIDAGHSNLREVPMRFVKKALFGKYLIEIKARKKQARKQKEFEDKKHAQSELKSIKAELEILTSAVESLEKEADSSVVMPMYYVITDKDILAYANGSIYKNKIESGQMTDEDWKSLIWETGRWMPHVGREKVSQHFPVEAEYKFDPEQIAKIKTMFSALPKGASLEKAAEPPEPTMAPSKDPQVPMEPVPTEYKELKISPKDTEKRQKEMADAEFQVVLNDYKETKEKIDHVDRMIAAITAHLKTRIRAVEERGRKTELLLEAQQKLEQVASLVEKAKDKVILAGNELYTLREETKIKPYKVSPKEMLEKIIAKYDLKALGVDKFMQDVENGAHRLDEEIQTRQLIKSPYPHKATSALSKLDKEAGIMDTIDYLLESVAALLGALPGTEPTPAPAEASKIDKLEK